MDYRNIFIIDSSTSVFMTLFVSAEHKAGKLFVVNGSVVPWSLGPWRPQQFYIILKEMALVQIPSK
jgi:hypothetical protein